MTAPLAFPAPRVSAPPRPPLLQSGAGRRTALVVLLVAAALLYSVRVSASGWANAYYSAASQAGARSWKAMLFGGLDPGGGITVDKPPAALWLTDLSVRVFGLSPQALMLPQAACGVASVALLYGAVRRQALSLVGGADADTDRAQEARAAAVALFAAGALAVTPVATLMARYNNPDALMVTLSLGAAYSVVRSVGAARGGGGWLALAGALLGLAFLTKLLQAWLILPAFVCVALVAGAGPLRRRLARVLVAGLAMVAAAGWWVLLVQLTPAADRPWIGGTRSNSALELALGYNGLGRVTGQENGGGAADLVRSANWGRLFGTWAPEAGWLLPGALVGLLAGTVLTRNRGRRDPVRAGLLLWGVWLLGAGVVLSSLRGISHSYYAVQLAPAVAGGVALGGALLADRVSSATGGPAARRVLAVTVAGSALWSAGLLLSRPAWPMAAAIVPVAAASVAVLGLLAASGAGRQRLTAIAVIAALLSGPAVWSVATAASVHRGANVSSGPGVFEVRTPTGFAAGTVSSLRLPTSLAHTVAAGAPGYDWAAAVVGRHAADLQLASGAPVWAIGGFNGADPHPTLAEFTAAVAAHRVHYLAIYGSPGSGPSMAREFAQWAVGVGSVQRIQKWTLIDLSSAAAAPAP